MKIHSRTLALILTVILSVCLVVLPVAATTETADGLELTLTTDKAEYENGEKIVASLTLKNITQAPFSNLVAEHMVPQGLRAVGGSTKELIQSLAAGESVTVTAELLIDLVPETGDHGIAAIALAMALSGIGLVYLGAQNTKLRKSIVSVFLCCIMLAGIALPVSAAGLADGVTVSTTVKIDGEVQTLSAVVKQLEDAPEQPSKPVDPQDTVTVNVADLTNGTVTLNKQSYEVGDTVTLTVTPAEGYSQKLYINGEPLLLDWKSNTYSFVATEKVYNITGSFETSWFTKLDNSKWDPANQAHGELRTYYESGDASWYWTNGEYASISVMVKNYDSTDADGFFTLLCFNIKNDDINKNYSFRIIKQDGLYYCQRAGFDGWDKVALDEDAVNAIKGEGAEFKLARTATDTLTLSVNGKVVYTYTLTGEAVNAPVAAACIGHDGNDGKHVTIPFKLVKQEDAPEQPSKPVDPQNTVTVNVADLTNGTVTLNKQSYEVGDTVTLTVTPAEGYSQKLYINGEPLLLDWKSNTYSFVATEKVYNITGSFETSWFTKLDNSKWDPANQAHGELRTYYESGDASWYWTNGEYASISVMVKNYDSTDADGFFTLLCFNIKNDDFNKNYSFRIIKQDGLYYCQRAGFDGWDKVVLDEDAVNAIKGEGAEFKLARTATDTLTLSVNGKVVYTYTLTGEAVNAPVAAACICHDGNDGKHVTIPFKLVEQEDAPEQPSKPVDPQDTVTVNVADLTNGTVTLNKQSYEVGDTVTLTVTPAEGYSQKLYINGEPLLLDWKSDTYSFVATEKVYNITGSFETSVFTSNAKWDAANQAHGELRTYYESGDSGWYGVDGEYKSISVMVKNYDSTDADGFGTVLIFKIDGKNYNFRVTKSGGKYWCQRMGFAKKADGSADWTKIELDAEAVAAIKGTGAEFKLERTTADTLTLSVNGKVYDTFTLTGDAVNAPVSRASICSEKNIGLHVTIPFKLVKQEGKLPNFATVTVPTLENGTVTTDKESYEVGDTVTLTVAPAEGYSQKLYINGEPLLLDWKSDTYSFVATEKVYNITGSFETSVFTSNAKWDAANQAHGELRTYYESGDSGWYGVDGEYKSISVMVKNYDSTDADGFGTVLIFKIDGKNYNFRVTKSGGKYWCQRMGFAKKADGSADWTKIELDAEAVAAIKGTGAEFKLERTTADTLTLSVNGKVYDTFTLTGDAVNAPVSRASICSEKNIGLHVTIPFKLVKQEGKLPNFATVTVPTLENGTVTTDKESYEVGDTVTLTVAPAEGYSQKLYINGEPLLLDWKSDTYSFVATEKVYNITGSFETSVFTSNAKWDAANQAHGELRTYYESGDSGWYGVDGEYKSISVMVKNYDSTDADGFGTVLIFKIDGKNYNFRVTKSGGKYWCQRMGFAKKADGSADWTKIELDAEAVAAIKGTGAEFKLERTTADTLTLSVNGKVYDTFTLTGDAVNAPVSRASICSEKNIGLHVTIPFVLTPVVK